MLVANHFVVLEAVLIRLHAFEHGRYRRGLLAPTVTSISTGVLETDDSQCFALRTLWSATLLFNVSLRAPRVGAIDTSVRSF